MYDIEDFRRYDVFGLDIGCLQTMLYINDQQNNSYVNSGDIVTFKVCGKPGIDFIIQDVGIQNGGNNINDFYPYNVIDRGQLDSNGIYIFSIPLNKVGIFVFRVGILCTVADIDYCNQVSNTVTITVLEKGCVATYVCRQPLNGYEFDSSKCGGTDRLNSKCNPPIGSGNDDDNYIYNLLKVGVVVAIAGIVVNYCVNKKC